MRNERVPAVVDGQRAEPDAAENATRRVEPSAKHVSVEPAPVRCPLERTNKRIARRGAMVFAVTLPRGEVGERAEFPPERHTRPTFAFGELKHSPRDGDGTDGDANHEH